MRTFLPNQYTSPFVEVVGTVGQDLTVEEGSVTSFGDNFGARRCVAAASRRVAPLTRARRHGHVQCAGRAGQRQAAVPLHVKRTVRVPTRSVYFARRETRIRSAQSVSW